MFKDSIALVRFASGNVCFKTPQPTENHESLARCDGGTCKQQQQQQEYDASAAQLFPAEAPLMDNSLLRPNTFLLFLLRCTRPTFLFLLLGSTLFSFLPFHLLMCTFFNLNCCILLLWDMFAVCCKTHSIAALFP